ncbi:SUMF1/EgtB/PvdO family nonheme iron enzyme [Brenneria populi]|uniref:SUMF1/EgtB/PvdO family nonheme iron enzyme n=1 Tax=Brenneria populi TaxID=1505588 RepID=A0ABU6JYV8_9GAMM|nr:SUMF1/EgtB/PvdO family nonheme iron enzyme [Brenneria populi Li et al. 2015]
MKKMIIIILFPLLTIACDDKTTLTSSQIKTRDEIVKRSMENMVAIKGDTFQMGDFGKLVGEKLPLTSEPDNKILHDVTLRDFSISKYKVTYRDYNAYLSLTGQEKPEVSLMFKALENKILAPDMPAAMNWKQAKDYCQWLGKAAGKNIDLPTEAQWEYAARNGGKMVIYATDNGQYEEGRNLANSDQKMAMTGVSSLNYPVGKFPPTPLGLYDMAGNGVDWINDWYDPDYYARSEKIDPRGPDHGTKKVVRGYQSGGGAFANQTVFRQFIEPDANSKGRMVLPAYNARCVINP